MRKRIFTLVLTAVMAVSVCGCGNSKQDRGNGGADSMETGAEVPGGDGETDAGSSGTGDVVLTQGDLTVILHGDKSADFIVENALIEKGSNGFVKVKFDAPDGVYGIGLNDFGADSLQCSFWKQDDSNPNRSNRVGDGDCEFAYSGTQLTLSLNLDEFDVSFGFNDVGTFSLENGAIGYIVTKEPVTIVVKGEDTPQLPADSNEPMRYDYGNLYYVYNDEGGVTIVSGSIATEREIPDKIDGKPVTELGDALFAYGGAGLVTSVVIPDTVTKIGSNTFANCSNITSITLPARLKEIGEAAFDGCSFTSVTLPEGVKSIGRAAFRNCKSLESINIPESVESIGESAFYECEKLQSIAIPGSVETIRQWTFSNCRSLTSVTLGEGIREIGESAFQSSGVTSITIPGSMETYGERIFYECHSLKNVTFQSGVQAIGVAMFEQCENLSSVIIPDSVTEIGTLAFSQCTNLTGVALPPDLRVIDQGVFSSTGLTSIEIPYGVTSIGRGAFSSCVRLSSVTVPDSVTEIGDVAFSFCSSLKSISLPGGVKMGKKVFNYSPTKATYR